MWHRINHTRRLNRGVAAAVLAPIAAAAIIGACVFDTSTSLCPSGERCRAGQVCAAKQDVCVDVDGCGDGFLREERGEVCDDGNISSGDGCNADCTSLEVCGDGVVNKETGETCDDGDRIPDINCSADCKAATCGNFILDAGEVCDDGDTVSADGCSSTCTSNEACGNGTVDNDGSSLVEECDDVNTFPQRPPDTELCDSDCTRPSCGDGHLNTKYKMEPGNDREECDAGGDSATCDKDCTFIECGDEYVNTAAGEQCDQGKDNSNLPGSACRMNCRNPSCGDGIEDGLEQCDDSNDDTTDDCPSGPLGTCLPARCGDGFIRANFEQCERDADCPGQQVCNGCQCRPPS